MINEKIGIIGEAFIQKRIEMGIDFDTVWDDWQKIQEKLMFVIVDCPEVQLYDDRRFADRQERQRIRRFAKAKVGDHIRSADVSLLGSLAKWLAVEIPVRPYRLDRGIVADLMERFAHALELQEGFNDDVANAREIAESEEEIDEFAQGAECFAEIHGLWAVPPRRLIGLYINHLQRLLKTSFEYAACGNETEITVDHSAGNVQTLTKVCPECKCNNVLIMRVHDDDEAHVFWVVLEPSGKPTSS